MNSKPGTNAVTISYTEFDSPLGQITIAASERGLIAVLFADMPSVADIVRQARRAEPEEHPIMDLCIAQLQEYFAGKRTHFDLPLDMQGTAFQQQVWHALCQIPYGETRDYSQQAELIQRPKAVRAVGAANGRNLLGIVVPCHRVIGKNGSLTGYAGGLNRKQWLLAHEKKILNAAQHA